MTTPREALAEELDRVQRLSRRFEKDGDTALEHYYNGASDGVARALELLEPERAEKKLYNASVRVVHLVWADSPEEAERLLIETVRRTGVEVIDGEGSVFISEPVPEHGWKGDPDGSV